MTESDKNPNTKSHKELYSVNKEYDPILNEKLRLLYQGGFAIRANADLFLEQIKGIETSDAFRERKKCVAYIPYLWEFISQITSSLFSESLEVGLPGDATDPSTTGNADLPPFYDDFFDACDKEERSLHQFMQDTLENSLSQLKTYICVDLPAAPEGAIIPSRQAEKMLGLDEGYLYTIPYANVIDWKINAATGDYDWMKEFEECFTNDDPLQEVKHYYQFKIRTMKKGPKGMVGGWDIWRSKIMPIKEQFTTTTKYTHITAESGLTSFPKINVLSFCIPKAYHVGQQIGSLCEEHYQRRSLLVSNSNKTCVAIGTINIGPEMSAPGDSIPADIDVPQDSKELRRRLESDGWVVLRTADGWKEEVKIVEAEGKSHKFVSDELVRLVEAMMQTLRQMNMTAAANTKSVGRSGSSKQMDQHGTSMLLSVYERQVKDFTRKLMMCLSSGRKDEDIKWSVEGLSIAEPTLQKPELISELTQFGVDIMKFPDMWKQKYLPSKAVELLDNELTEKERKELDDKFAELIQSGAFKAIDEAEATAAGNKMAQTTAAEGGNNPADPTNAQVPTSQADIDPKTMSNRSVSTAGVASSVMDQLKPDYSKNLLQWVPAAHWIHADVPMDQIDSSNRANWDASKNMDKVNNMAQAMQEGWQKPIVLVNEPNSSLMKLVDGHHRFLANEQNGEQNISAYVAYVGGIDGQWKDMHDLQNQGDDGGKSAQKSQQSNQT